MFFKRNIEFLEILLYLTIAAVLVYFIPAPFNKLIFLIVLPIAWRTRRDYLWLCFFFIVEDMPGGLFSGGLANDPYRLPLYTIVPGISFSIRELYILLLLMKMFYKPGYRQNRQRNYFSKEMSALGYYFIILFIISTLLGMTIQNYRDFYKICIELSIFISVPVILRDNDYFRRFLRILFPFAIVAIVFQVYSLTFGQQLIAVFKPGVSAVQGILQTGNSAEGWKRPIEMVHVLLVCFAGSLFFLHKSEKTFKSGYLVTINTLSFLGIFLTGTRTWFLALIVAYSYFFLLQLNQIFSGLVKNSIMVFLLIVGISFIPIIRNQINNAWSRLSTLEMVAEGDITAGGTASRFDVRGPRVMEGYRSSTIIMGAGFSKLYFEYQDGHVGYHNMLLNTGIIGMLLFAVIIAKAIILPYNLSKSKTLSGQSKHELRASSLLLIALLVLNTGTQTLGYYPGGGNRFLLMVLALTFINQAINSAIGYKIAWKTAYKNITPSNNTGITT